MPGVPKQLHKVVPTLLAAALSARVGAPGFRSSTYADHVLNHPALALRLTTMQNTWASAWIQNCESSLEFTILLYYFIAASEPVTDVPELFRVEDTRAGWALQFRERDLCLSNRERAALAAENEVPLWSDSTYSFDLSWCKDKLLRPGQLLTLDVMVDTSGSGCTRAYCIYNWTTPAAHSFLRWHILPPVNRTRVVGGYAVFLRGLHNNESVRGGSTSLLRNEIMLLPGSQIQVIGLERDPESGYYTCTARQVLRS